MKIKEVMTATGLTEKTIRYYEERALITPETYRQNGRTYHEYSKEDVAALKHIVSLRQAQFTLEEIRRMQQDAGTIPEILSDHHKRIAAQRESLEALADLSESEAKSWDALAQELTDRYRRTPDYQPTLRFAEFDPESEAQREAELRKVRQRHSHSLFLRQRSRLSRLALYVLRFLHWLLFYSLVRVARYLYPMTQLLTGIIMSQRKDSCGRRTGIKRDSLYSGEIPLTRQFPIAWDRIRSMCSLTKNSIP